jgi:hypothetical protein
MPTNQTMYKTFTVSDTGGAPLNIGQASVTGNGASPSFPTRTSARTGR